MKNADPICALRRSIMTILLLSLVLQVRAQSDEIKNLAQFLFPQFSKSILKMKTGKDLTLMLNYNVVTELIVFIQKDQVFDLLNPETVDTVIMNSRLFIPVGKIFHEVLLEGPIDLFLQYKGSILDPPRPAGYGGTSQVSNSTNISRITMGNGTAVYNMPLPEDFSVKLELIYWINLNENKFSFVNERQFLKIFKGKETEIKKYIKDNHLKFENTPDVVKLVGYCSELTK
jgi:hypothetical protein